MFLPTPIGGPGIEWINIYANDHAIQVEIEVQCTRFLQTDREFSFRKSIPELIFAKSKGHNSART